MQNPSFGSGTSLLGGAPAGAVLGMPGMQQQTPSSSAFTPGLLPPPPNAQGAPPQMNPLPGAPAMGQQPMQTPQVPQAPQPMGGVVGMPQGNTETLMILKALTNRLAAHTKAEEMARGGE